MRVALAILVGLGACSAPGGEIATPDASPGPDGGRKGMYTAGRLARAVRGHEDLVRFAIDVANTLLLLETGQENYFTQVLSGVMCGDTDHPILQGNCATDDPDEAMASHYGASAGSWHSNPNLQSLHFLRDYDGMGLYGGKESCLRARSRIIQATAFAMQLWEGGDRDAAEYWVGHATHTIQDSFSPAHTSRTVELRFLSDLCSYGRRVEGICYHGAIDARDGIWRRWCLPDPTDRSWDCLTPQAQQAVYSSAGYLVLVARHAAGGFAGDLEQKLADYFETDSDAYSGFHRCDWVW